MPVLKTLKDSGFKKVQMQQDKLFIGGKECGEDTYNNLMNSKLLRVYNMMHVPNTFEEFQVQLSNINH